MSGYINLNAGESRIEQDRNSSKLKPKKRMYFDANLDSVDALIIKYTGFEEWKLAKCFITLHNKLMCPDIVLLPIHLTQFWIKCPASSIFDFSKVQISAKLYEYKQNKCWVQRCTANLTEVKSNYLADKSLMCDAIRQSEDLQLEQAMLEDKLKATDWEATNEVIEEQIARESYLQWLRDNEKRARKQCALT
uniref:Uncharacterized protein n=1 Tax=Strigamia maritima TaxID=126957 RepID=T1JPB8_STRMM